MNTKCVLCGREGVTITEHHLIPKTLHKRYKNTYTKSELHHTIDTCKECHKQIHALISERACATTFNTVELLKEHIGMKKFIKWIQKQRIDKKIQTKRAKGK